MLPKVQPTPENKTMSALLVDGKEALKVFYCQLAKVNEEEKLMSGKIKKVEKLILKLLPVCEALLLQAAECQRQDSLDLASNIFWALTDAVECYLRAVEMSLPLEDDRSADDCALIVDIGSLAMMVGQIKERLEAVVDASKKWPENNFEQSLLNLLEKFKMRKDNLSLLKTEKMLGLVNVCYGTVLVTIAQQTKLIGELCESREKIDLFDLGLNFAIAYYLTAAFSIKLTPNSPWEDLKIYLEKYEKLCEARSPAFNFYQVLDKELAAFLRQERRHQLLSAKALYLHQTAWDSLHIYSLMRSYIERFHPLEERKSHIKQDFGFGLIYIADALIRYDKSGLKEVLKIARKMFANLREGFFDSSVFEGIPDIDDFREKFKIRLEVVGKEILFHENKVAVRDSFLLSRSEIFPLMPEIVERVDGFYQASEFRKINDFLSKKLASVEGHINKISENPSATDFYKPGAILSIVELYAGSSPYTDGQLFFSTLSSLKEWFLEKWWKFSPGESFQKAFRRAKVAGNPGKKEISAQEAFPQPIRGSTVEKAPQKSDANFLDSLRKFELSKDQLKVFMPKKMLGIDFLNNGTSDVAVSAQINFIQDFLGNIKGSDLFFLALNFSLIYYLILTFSIDVNGDDLWVKLGGFLEKYNLECARLDPDFSFSKMVQKELEAKATDKGKVKDKDKPKDKDKGKAKAKDKAEAEVKKSLLIEFYLVSPKDKRFDALAWRKANLKRLDPASKVYRRQSSKVKVEESGLTMLQTKHHDERMQEVTAGLIKQFPLIAIDDQGLKNVANFTIQSKALEALKKMASLCGDDLDKETSNVSVKLERAKEKLGDRCKKLEQKKSEAEKIKEIEGQKKAESEAEKKKVEAANLEVADHTVSAVSRVIKYKRMCNEIEPAVKKYVKDFQDQYKGVDVANNMLVNLAWLLAKKYWLNENKAHLLGPVYNATLEKWNGAIEVRKARSSFKLLQVVADQIAEKIARSLIEGLPQLISQPDYCLARAEKAEQERDEWRQRAVNAEAEVKRLVSKVDLLEGRENLGRIFGVQSNQSPLLFATRGTVSPRNVQTAALSGPQRQPN
jgi:hypothetical protein